MTKRSRIQQQRLDGLEQEFHSLLLTCLRACANGRYGLFGQNEHLDPEGQFWGWPEADHLKELAKQIRTIRLGVGVRNEACEKFLDLCSLGGSNVPGEPKLAAAFLAEIGQGS